MEEIFKRLRDANLKLKAKKCLFLRKQVPYLGHIVTRDGIKPDPEKTKSDYFRFRCFSVTTVLRDLPFIEPRHRREGYGNHCVCVCVCYCASGYVCGLYVQTSDVYNFLYAFKDIYCVDLAENVLFGRYDTIYQPR